MFSHKSTKRGSGRKILTRRSQRAQRPSQKFWLRRGGGKCFRRAMAEAISRKWTRDELLIALNLYHKLNFGQFTSRNPVIMAVAKKLGRKPGGLSMKLCNLASFDPALKMRGINGLSGASKLDKLIW